MAVSKTWTRLQKNVDKVLALYRSKALPTTEQIASQLQTTCHNVAYVLKTYMPEAERKALAKVRYSASKTGIKNPMRGKTREQHPRWKGECKDGHGYLTCLHNGKRQFVHRVVMAKALGLQELPAHLEPHHIDDNKMNNTLDNLALVTRKGHTAIHYLQRKDSMAVQLKKSTIADALKYMT